MTDFVVLELPLEERAGFDALLQHAVAEAQILERRALDGDTVLHATMVVSLASLPVIKAWIRGRVEMRKAATISIKGRRIVGYSAREVTEIMRSLDKMLEDGEAQSPPKKSDDDSGNEADKTQ